MAHGHHVASTWGNVSCRRTFTIGRCTLAMSATRDLRVVSQPYLSEDRHGCAGPRAIVACIVEAFRSEPITPFFADPGEEVTLWTDLAEAALSALPQGPQQAHTIFWIPSPAECAGPGDADAQAASAQQPDVAGLDIVDGKCPQLLEIASTPQSPPSAPEGGAAQAATPTPVPPSETGPPPRHPHQPAIGALAICTLWSLEEDGVPEWPMPDSIRRGSWQANLQMGQDWLHAERRLYERVGPFYSLDYIVSTCKGHGLGSALLQHLLSKADDEGKHVFLAAAGPRNRSWYLQYGFEELRHVRYTADDVEGLHVDYCYMARAPRKV